MTDNKTEQEKAKDEKAESSQHCLKLLKVLGTKKHNVNSKS